MGLLEGLFKDKDNSANKEIESLNVKIKEKEVEIQRLKMEVQMMKETYMTPKQVEILEKNLKSAREENTRLKKEKEDFIQKIKVLEEDSSDKEEVFFLNKFLYKLPIDEFFSATKFNLIREFLTKSGISFVQEIETVMELPEFMKVKNYSAAKKKYTAFRDLKVISWDNRILMCKGERIHKVFKKSRKFVNYLTENNIEFMDDMKNFDFNVLAVKGGFTKAAVEEFKEMYEEYFKTYKI